jgi:hypothetical protein
MSKYLSDVFIMQNDLQEENILPTRLLELSLETWVQTQCN